MLYTGWVSVTIKAQNGRVMYTTVIAITRKVFGISTINTESAVCYGIF